MNYLFIMVTRNENCPACPWIQYQVNVRIYKLCHRELQAVSQRRSHENKICICHSFSCGMRFSQHESPKSQHESLATSAGIGDKCWENASHMKNHDRCIFSHDTNRKAVKIPFLNEISLNIVWRHVKLLTSNIGAQEVVPRIGRSLIGIYIDVWTPN